MAIVAEILLADRTLPLVDVADSIPSGELSVSNWLPLEDGRVLVTVCVETASREAFDREVETAADRIECVEIGKTTDGWFYQLTLRDESGLVASHDPAEFEGAAVDTTVTGEGLRERKVFADYDALGTLRDRCAVHDIPFELLAIAADPENPGEQDRFGLTERQYRAISVAFANGYYDSPRGCSTEELGDELGIAAPSASDLLRRAEKQLISQSLAPEKDLNRLTH